MPLLPMISATKTLNKVLCLAADIQHPDFPNGGVYYICNDTIEHTRIDKSGKELIYQPCPFSFNLPSQSETDNSTFGVSNVGLICSDILSYADNSIIDISIHCWLIVGEYDGSSNWIDLGEYYWQTEQTETIETVTGSLMMKNCYSINAGKYRGNNPSIFINLNYR